MTALSDALRAANTAGSSARRLARDAKALGFTLNHDTAARYLRGDHGRPDEATLAAFAAVLDVDLTALRSAADLPTERIDPYVPPTEASRLSTRQRRAVDEVIRVMLEGPPASVTELEARRRKNQPGTASPESDAARAARRGSVEPPTT